MRSGWKIFPSAGFFFVPKSHQWVDALFCSSPVRGDPVTSSPAVLFTNRFYIRSLRALGCIPIASAFRTRGPCRRGRIAIGEIVCVVFLKASWERRGVLFCVASRLRIDRRAPQMRMWSGLDMDQLMGAIFLFQAVDSSQSFRSASATPSRFAFATLKPRAADCRDHALSRELLKLGEFCFSSGLH